MPMLAVEKVTFAYPKDKEDPSKGLGKTLFQDVDFGLNMDSRVALVGANGTGKSTLLKAIVGELTPQDGDFQQGTHAPIGYFAQHQLEALDSDNTAYAAMSALREDFSEQQCRDFLGGWGFDANMISRPIRSLSGGEKARFVLAQLAAEKPALLVLDEPTNHLDLDMRDALALALQAYAGAVLIVAHDREL